MRVIPFTEAVELHARKLVCLIDVCGDYEARNADFEDRDGTLVAVTNIGLYTWNGSTWTGPEDV